MSEHIKPWGEDWKARDKSLRDFYLEEDILLSSVYNIAEQRSSLSYKLKGTPEAIRLAREIINNSQNGEGWNTMMKLVIVDLLTQDNGAFIEIVRSERKPDAPVLFLRHIPSHMCERTGNPRKPVRVRNGTDEGRLMQWYDIICLTDMPHPDTQKHKGRQVSYLSRVLKTAQLIREIADYKAQKVSGEFAKNIHVVSGVSRKEINAELESAQRQGRNSGGKRSSPHAILTTIDSSAKVGHVEIRLADLPDNYDENLTLTWYITLLAMAVGGEYQDFSPMPQGGMTNSDQTDNLRLKAQQKGTTGFIKLIEHKLRFHNVFPVNVEFSYKAQDTRSTSEKLKVVADTVKFVTELLNSNIINRRLARQMLVEYEVLNPAHLAYFEEQELTDWITISDDQSFVDIVNKEVHGDKPIPASALLALGKHIRSTYLNSPYEHLYETFEPQLKVFVQHILKQLNRPTKLVFSSTNDIVMGACEVSGIHISQVVRRFSRKSDNKTQHAWEVYVTPTQLTDNFGTDIFTLNEIGESIYKDYGQSYKHKLEGRAAYIEYKQDEPSHDTVTRFIERSNDLDFNRNEDVLEYCYRYMALLDYLGFDREYTESRLALLDGVVKNHPGATAKLMVDCYVYEDGINSKTLT